MSADVVALPEVERNDAAGHPPIDTPGLSPPLGGATSSELEATLVVAARNGCGEARARLISTYTPLIGSVARTYTHVPGVDRSELMQEGVVGVLRALERFNADLGTPFWAYASWWVRQAMQQLVSELSRPVVLSDRALRQLARLRAARRSFVCAHSREPSLPELAVASELTMLQLQSLLVAERQPRALQEPIDGAASGGATFGDLLADPAAEEAFEELAMNIGSADVPRLLTHLSVRERQVVESRYGLCGPERTLRQLGQAMGVSAERVRQIEQGALEKMRVCASARRAGQAGTSQQRRARGRRRLHDSERDGARQISASARRR